MDSLSLKEYLGRVRQAVSLGVEHDVWVRAEVSELKVNGSGHCYLTLIEKEDSGRMTVCAKANAIIWANAYRIMAPMFEKVTNERLQPGMTVLVRVSPNFHEAFGFSLIIADIDPTFTLGDMARRRQEVIEKLKADGVWNMNHDLELSPLPQRIAVISSETAAGFGDFINQLQQNERGFKFYWHLFPAIMQGADAPYSIMEALDAVFAVKDLFDVVCIVRGGGASADMLAFDDYDLTSCCAQFPLPILSGVGHERDTCVLDMVAYRRCKTPTAVAAFLIECMEQQYTTLCDAQRVLADSCQQRLLEQKQRLTNYVYSFSKTVPLAMAEEQNRMAMVSSALRVAVVERCQKEKTGLDRISARIGAGVRFLHHEAIQRLVLENDKLRRSVSVLVTQKQNRLELLAQKVDLLSPATLLKKGYSLTLKEGKTVRSADELVPGDVLTSVFADGSVESVVSK